MGETASDRLVSVIVPAYRAEQTLAGTLHSACAQQGVELEILVVDDGSGDGTAAVAEAFGPPVRVIRQANAGVGAARNRALAEARGRWVAFLDADDQWKPDKLQRQLHLLQALGEPYGLCYTGIELIDTEDAPLPHVSWTAPGDRPQGWVFRPLLFQGNFVATSSVLVSRRLLEDVGPFVTESTYSEDYDMWLRLAWRTSFCHLPQPLVRYRLDPVSYSHADPLKAKMRSMRTFDRAVAQAGFTGWPDRVALRRRRARLYFELAWSLKEQGRDAQAASMLLRSLGQAPQLETVGQLATLALPSSLRSSLRQLRDQVRRGVAPPAPRAAGDEGGSLVG